MKVKELIEQLQKMPPDSNVMYAWDGEARSNADLVFLSRSGIVIIAEYDEPIYSTEYRPEGVPTEDEVPSWRTPKNPNPKPGDFDYED